VFSEHPRIGLGAGRGQDRLISLRQLIPSPEIDVGRGLRLPLPPARIVVVFGDLIETELLVVVRPDPLRGVDRALFQSGIDVAAGDLLRYDARLGDPATPRPSVPQFWAVRPTDGFIPLPFPPATCAPVMTR